MKRRGFLGILGGAVVAGPAMAKQAVADLSSTYLGSVSGASGLVGGYGMPTMALAGQSIGPNFAAELATLIGRTAAQHREEIAKLHVHTLDPDIAEYRSMRLQAKIRMQRERDYWRNLNQQKSWLQRAAEGLF